MSYATDGSTAAGGLDQTEWKSLGARRQHDDVREPHEIRNVLPEAEKSNALFDSEFRARARACSQIGAAVLDVVADDEEAHPRLHA